MALPATDTFTNTNGTALTTHSASWSYGAGTFAIDSNAVHCTAGLTDSIAYWNADSFNANQYAECTTVAALDTKYIGIAVRATTGGNGYSVYWDSNEILFAKFTSGTWAQLGSTIASTPGDGVRVRLEATGTTTTTLELFFDDVSQGTRTDSTSPYTSGAPGLSGYDTSTSSLIDSWEGGNIAASVESTIYPGRSLLVSTSDVGGYYL